MAHAPIYVLWHQRGIDFPEVLITISPAVWQHAQHDPRCRKITYTAAHRWVRLGKPNLTPLRINRYGRIMRAEPLAIFYEEHPEMRDYHRRVLRYADRAGATDIRLEPGSGHPRLYFRDAEGSEHWVSLAWSPSDRRAYLNDTARIRRVLKTGRSLRGSDGLGRK